MFGQPTVDVVSLGGNPHQQTTLPPSIDLTDATNIWLGFYSESTGGGDYLYTIGTSGGGGTYSHQQDGDVEIYNGSSTFEGDSVVAFRSIYTVWTTQYFGGTPAENHVAYAD